MKHNFFTLLKNLFSFETAFVLFLFSYQYKNAHPIFLSPDITLTLIGILIPWTVILARKSPNRLFTSTTASFLLFSIWCIASAFWAPKLSYTVSKSLCFVVYTLPAFFMGYMVIASDTERLKRFFVIIAVFAILVHLEAYRVFYYSAGYIVDVLGNNYLVTGQTLGCGFILLVVYVKTLAFHFKPNTNFLYGLLMLLCGTFFYIQLNLGGRGPVISVLLVLMVFYSYGILRTSDHQQYLRHLFHLTFACALSYWLLRWLFAAESNHFIVRTYALITAPELDDPINWRIGYYQSAINAFLNHPLIGVGFGGWVNYHDMGSLPWQHPHNIVLEVLSETGVIGGVLAAWFGFNVLKNISYKNLNQSSLHMATTSLLLFGLLNALKSGDLNDNILLFVMSGIILGVASLKKPTYTFPQ
jgi:O-antigen ligase